MLKPLRWYRELKTASGRYSSGLFLVEGVRAIRQVLSVYSEGLDELLVATTFDIAGGEFSSYPRHIISETNFRSIVNSTSPQGIAAVFRIPDESNSIELPQDPGKHIVLLDDIQDPGNVGTIIRSAAAFNFDGVLLSHQCADPFSPKVVQASAGALFAPWIRRSQTIPSHIATLQRKGFHLACADVNGIPEIDFGRFEKVIIALGNEGAGLSDAVLDRADIRFSIPMIGTAVESLNVGVSGAICLFAIFRQCGWSA